jgi:hypothetical protein
MTCAPTALLPRSYRAALYPHTPMREERSANAHPRPNTPAERCSRRFEGGGKQRHRSIGKQRSA